jgi:WS/DGAT/MGAT family acyltransferase
VEGLGADRWAVLWKLHHAMVDGVTANEINTVILAETPEAHAPAPAPWRPEPPPGWRAVTGESLRGLSRLDQLRALEGALETPRDLFKRGLLMARTVLPLGRTLAEATTSSLNGPIGPYRRFARTTISLQAVKSIRSRYGGTVNDVVLAAVASGFRELLAARNELEPSSAVRTMVPVSVRTPGENGGNQVSAVFVSLPVGEQDPVRRLEAISQRMSETKRRGDAVAGQVLVGLQGFSPPMLLALGSRLAARLPQRTVNTVTTNVPGPQHALYLLGRRMLEAGPYVMLGPQIRIATAIFSYDGNLYIGVAGDYDTVPDIDVMRAGIDRGIAELSDAGRQPSPDLRKAGPGHKKADGIGAGGA